MDLNIKYCNNIEEGSIHIEENALNIKYAINGTGKTTISKAIEYSIKSNNNYPNYTKSIDNLKPFKYLNDSEDSRDKKPSISGIENFKKVAVFNDEYINKYIYMPDELVKNSFEIFIKDKNYDEHMIAINKLIESITNTFKENEDLDILINDLKELSVCFGKSKSGYSAAGSIGKGLGKGNKIENIPEGLVGYSEYLRSDSNAQWLKWQMSGKDYLEIAHKCPYCTSDIETKKETILLVSTEYDAKVIEHLNKVISVFERLNTYFTKITNDKISIITKNINGILPEQKQFLIEIKGQVDVLIDKLEKIKYINFNTLKNVDKVIEIIKNDKIDINFFSHLDTENTKDKINVINTSLDVILQEAGKLQGEVNKQKGNIGKTIKQYNTEINDFLKYAGYNYNVDIKLDKDEVYKMNLNYNGYVDNISDVKLHLSYGEKNAFALVLFMYESLKNLQDFIILDDPISSFDKNKKFAIINMLFKGKNCFRDKTVLILTHDFDPIIDIIYNFSDKLEPVPQATFLENKDGNLKEIEIKKNDIKTFIAIANENIDKLSENVNKLIYLRRNCEINNDKTEVYNLISNLMHKREKPIMGKQDNYRIMTEIEIDKGTKIIQNKISSFNYLVEYNKIRDVNRMVKIYRNSKNNYEKLQIYRIINSDNSDNDVIRKFVNETFHVENDYIFQLNPFKYEIIPQYIIDECNKDIDLLDVAENEAAIAK